VFGAAGGSIINLRSIVGSHPVAGALLYASTRGAIETLTMGLALEGASAGIAVTATLAVRR
jgi:3-oxoacyl-[acyl-carrier protein] reductase